MDVVHFTYNFICRWAEVEKFFPELFLDFVANEQAIFKKKSQEYMYSILINFFYITHSFHDCLITIWIDNGIV